MNTAGTCYLQPGTKGEALSCVTLYNELPIIQANEGEKPQIIEECG
jgi:hypothetical protein